MRVAVFTSSQLKANCTNGPLEPLLPWFPVVLKDLTRSSSLHSDPNLTLVLSNRCGPKPPLDHVDGIFAKQMLL